MGYADRDWNRAPQRARPAGRRWSVTGVIITLCVAVFVVDGFLGGKGRTNIIIDRTTLDGQPLPATFAKATPSGTAITLVQAAQQWGPGVVAAANRVGLATRDTWVQPLEQQGALVGLAFSLRSTPLSAWLHFSTSTALLGDSGSGPGVPQVWRFIGFQFLHANLTHLLYNMMGLWFFGPVVERYLGGKRYGAFYLLCGICGAGMYLLLNFLGTHVPAGTHVPFVLPNAPTTPLVGASAGVFGVLMAAAFLAPRAEVLVFFVLPMQLRTVAYTLVAVALLSIFFGLDNAGGEAAHLGGAIAGYVLIRRPETLHALFDWMGRVDPTSRSRRIRRGRTAGVVAEAEIDRILDKIQRQGLHSLTDAERQTLREASRR